MKKFITILAALLLICGCEAVKCEAEKPTDNLMSEVYSTNTITRGFAIYKDTRTGVQYLVTIKGGVCVMVDADGKPLICEAEQNEIHTDSAAT